MSLREFNLQDLIPAVEAQSADTSAQPTFGTLEIGGGNTNQATVTLTADSTSTAVGNTLSVDVTINTGEFTISEYRIIINFDQTKLSVVDANPNQAGNQIEFLDSVFDLAPNGNSVDSGKITLIAKTPSGNAFSVNRAVAKIKFQGQNLGTTTIEPVSGIQGTQLINENGIAIPATLNSVTVVVSNTATTPTVTITPTTTSTSTSSVTSIPPVIDPDDDLPATGILDGNILPVVIGTILIILGVNLSRQRKRRDVI
jgi:hypothetical protein